MTVYGITVRNVLLFAGNIPRGVFVNKVHRKPENCGAKRVTVNGNHEKDFREL